VYRKYDRPGFTLIDDAPNPNVSFRSKWPPEVDGSVRFSEDSTHIQRVWRRGLIRAGNVPSADGY